MATALLSLGAAAPAAAHLDGSITLRAIDGEVLPVHLHGDPIWAFGPAGPPRSGQPPARGTAPATTIAGAWCGEQRTTDDAANEFGDPGAAKVKAVYVHPADRPDRFAQYADVIQADLKWAVEHVAAHSGTPGQQRSVRLDLGTACGPEYVDIATVRLQHEADRYEYYGVADEVRAALPAPPGKKWNYIVWADNVETFAGGEAELILDDRKGSENRNNAGGLVAIHWYGPWWDDPALAKHRREIPLHEIGHNLGAVQGRAPALVRVNNTGVELMPDDGPQPPNSSYAGHCTDEYDVMCYNDGGPGWDPMTGIGTPPPPACDAYPDGDEAWDCNGDDYFSPAPEPGSWLAGHWNLYDSVFMCPIAECAPPPPAPPPPPPPPPPEPDPDPDPPPDPDPDPDPEPDPEPRPQPDDDATDAARDDPQPSTASEPEPAREPPPGPPVLPAAAPPALDQPHAPASPRVRYAGLRRAGRRTILRFTLDVATPVRVRVLAGRRTVRTLSVAGRPGLNTVAARLRRGRYRVVLEAGATRATAVAVVR
ncbi:MAG TPA: hypothetical protein VHF89_18925 [Solirubrobacteraceae bacterium]|nr:hypothetical protein [Solirubrobacteraceae bacterium]